MKALKYILLGISFVFFSSCQTNMLKQFAGIENGMDKHDVLEKMGSPTTKTRLHGKDRWFYTFYEDSVRYDKEVHFLNGRTVYFGDTWVPTAEKSAETIDKNNEELNKSLDLADAQRKEEGKKAYLEHEKRVRFEDKVQYMPVFVPVD